MDKRPLSSGILLKISAIFWVGLIFHFLWFRDTRVIILSSLSLIFIYGIARYLENSHGEKKIRSKRS